MDHPDLADLADNGKSTDDFYTYNNQGDNPPEYDPEDTNWWNDGLEWDTVTHTYRFQDEPVESNIWYVRCKV